MICRLCLQEILPEEETVIVDKKIIRHKSCSDEYEAMIVDLEKIYNSEEPDEDI